MRNCGRPVGGCVSVTRCLGPGPARSWRRSGTGTRGVNGLFCVGCPARRVIIGAPEWHRALTATRRPRTPIRQAGSQRQSSLLRLPSTCTRPGSNHSHQPPDQLLGGPGSRPWANYPQYCHRVWPALVTRYLLLGLDVAHKPPASPLTLGASLRLLGMPPLRRPLEVLTAVEPPPRGA